MNTIDLINGVTLISSTQVDTFSAVRVFVFCFLGTLLICLIGSCVYFGIRTGEIKFSVVFSIFSFVVASFCFACAASETYVKNSPDRYKYKYVVTINENVSMKEFYDNYNIIKVEGEFYTVEEKVE